jgi:predicted dehydrogenase
MTHGTNRRQFLRQTSATMLGGGLAGLTWAGNVLGADAPAEKPAPAAGTVPLSEPFVMGIIGTGGRGQAVAAGFAAMPGVRIKYLCDVDDEMLARGQDAVAKRLAAAAATQQSGSAKGKPKADSKDNPAATTTSAAPTGVKDFRRVLEDKQVHAVAIAMPDHWHAAAAILACAAGKHVYVEKPCSHNPREGELLVEAARKSNRIVQHGTQRRSWPGVVKGIQAVRGGEIGNVRFARGWYAADRKSIGRGKGAAVPENLDYALWQGPAPERPYRDNVHPYNWHWFWHWGTGELGNLGAHFLDLCRWGLNVDFPKRVTSAGGRYFFADDQETPDTQSVTYEFGDRMILWEHRSSQPRGLDGKRAGVSFHGERGTLVIVDNGYHLYDLSDNLLQTFSEPVDIDSAHFAEFIDAARKGRRPNADIEDGHRSILLCHLGNIAFRTGRALDIDPKNGHIVGDAEAESKFWSREYRQGWEPKVATQP